MLFQYALERSSFQMLSGVIRKWSIDFKLSLLSLRSRLSLRKFGILWGYFWSRFSFSFAVCTAASFAGYLSKMKFCCIQHATKLSLTDFAACCKYQNSPSEIFQKKIIYYIEKRFLAVEENPLHWKKFSQMRSPSHGN